MSFFAIQVTSGREDAYIEFFSKLRPDQTLYNIKKKIRSRKKGKPTVVTTCLFPGYLFFQYPEDSLSGELLRTIRSTKYFIRVLPATDNIKALSERDASIIRQLVAFGGEIGSSVVSFDENNKIKVVQGPMMGMEGRIIKVDRRKKRAKVRLELNDSPISFDLSFEVLESVKEEQHENR
ncbi:MAG: transcription termination/antitermination NusG family protein [Spirochaetia bacterium]|nr:transcription termination/antitermination NusG family protein [Spirochaetia bacterium]